MTSKRENSRIYARLHDAAERARAEGYAVIIWLPEELGTADPGHIEDLSIGFGYDAIDMGQEHDE